MVRMRTLLLLLLLGLAPSGTGWAAAALEDLPYRVSLGVCEDVAQVHLTIKELGPGRYLAEFAGGGKGIWSLLSRWLPERYQTEMVLRDGRLQPLVFREELQIGGRRVVKEYRFDYQRNLLEYWRQTDDQQSSKRWQVPLQEPVYDPLTLFYNLRLGAFGALSGGETLTVATIPTPDPEKLIIRLGPETGRDRKIMLTIREKSGHERGPYFIDAGPQWVPKKAWLRVLQFGKLTGHLKDAGGIMKPDRLAGPNPPKPGSEPQK